MCCFCRGHSIYYVYSPRSQLNNQNISLPIQYKINYQMKFLKRSPVIQHFKIDFPIPSSRLQSCIAAMQNFNHQNTQAIFVSLNGFCTSPQFTQTLHDGFSVASQKAKVPVYTFLEQYVTSLSYLTATCGVISANPYCMIGDIGHTHKTYPNVKKLLDFMGINVQLLGSKQQQTKSWTPYLEPNQNQRKASEKWLNLVQKNMVQTISRKRNITTQTIQNLKNKLFTPKQALQSKLIDNIATLQQFKALHFPNLKIKQYLCSAISRQPNLSSGEIGVLMKFQEVLSMPQVGLLSMEDPLNDCLKELVQIIKIRVEDPEKLQQLDVFLGRISQKFQQKFQGKGYNFQ